MDLALELRVRLWGWGFRLRCTDVVISTLGTRARRSFLVLGLLLLDELRVINYAYVKIFTYACRCVCMHVYISIYLRMHAHAYV